MKYNQLIDNIKTRFVALFMGAWIEILNTVENESETIVALFMGAWIEINDVDFISSVSLAVALFMGAWIEIDNIIIVDFTAAASHSSWVRGLKYFAVA